MPKRIVNEKIWDLGSRWRHCTLESYANVRALNIEVGHKLMVTFMFPPIKSNVLVPAPETWLEEY